MEKNPFIKRLTTGGTRKLICFPFAGGYSLSFRPLSQFWNGSDWQVLALEPSGHGTNRGPLLTDLNQIVDLYLDALLPELNMPFVLFGHSMGGWVAFLLAQRLEARGIFPDLVLISAIAPPHIPRTRKSDLSDAEFLDYIISLGGIPKEFLAEKELLQYFLPIFRADFQAIETYEHLNTTVLRSPVQIFGGTKDVNYTKEDLQAWNVWAPQADVHWFDGGHMFLLDHTEAVVKRMLSLIESQSVHR